MIMVVSCEWEDGATPAFPHPIHSCAAVKFRSIFLGGSDKVVWEDIYAQKSSNYNLK